MKAVDVTVEAIDRIHGPRCGVTDDGLQTSTRRALTGGGVRIAAESPAYVYVVVTVFALPQHMSCVAHIAVSTREVTVARLSHRPSNSIVSAIMWEDTYTMTGPSDDFSSRVYSELATLVDGFTVAVRSANTP